MDAMKGMSVRNDGTVRRSSDGSIVQMAYGGDGFDAARLTRAKLLPPPPSPSFSPFSVLYSSSKSGGSDVLGSDVILAG
jgi:hypothetical protein